MKILLTRGMVALVDQEDYARVMQFKWCALKSRNRWYAVRKIPGSGQPGKQELLHQFISGRRGMDHRNGSGLDCRRENLRPATPSQNGCNRGKQRNNTSGFKGVARWRDERWQAGIKINGKRIYLGLFVELEAAARAYDDAAIRYHGEFAVLNFARLT